MLFCHAMHRKELRIVVIAQEQNFPFPFPLPFLSLPFFRRQGELKSLHFTEQFLRHRTRSVPVKQMLCTQFPLARWGSRWDPGTSMQCSLGFFGFLTWKSIVALPSTSLYTYTGSIKVAVVYSDYKKQMVTRQEGHRDCLPQLWS